MKNVLATLALLCLFVPLAQAQSLEQGTWTGTVTSPSDEIVDVTYEVSVENDTLAVTLKAPMGDFPFSDIEVSDTDFKFSWSPGPLLTCLLKKQDNGRYTGECADDGGDTGFLVMIPPGDE